MLASKLKDVPEEQREQLLAAVEANPQLFMQIAEEAQERIKKGEDQMQAMMAVMQAHKDDLMAAMGQKSA